MRVILQKIIASVAVIGYLGGLCINMFPNVSSCSNEVHVGETVVQGLGKQIEEKQQKNQEKNEEKGQKNSNKSWNHAMIQVVETLESTRTVKVAVIDSGVNFNSDINVVCRKNFIPGDEIDVMYEDLSCHGTAVAGIIGALDNEEGITGVNPNVEIYSARVLDNNLEAPVSRIVEAIDWAIEQKVDIINMSFGLQRNVPELSEAVKRAYAQGILLIAAAGNNRTVTYPAAYEEVIAVGSIDSSGLPAEGSAVGEELELTAPGENILASSAWGGVLGVSGTSMAAAHVTGVASVLMELNPDMPAEYIRALMDYSANLCGDKELYGNGVVDLGYAMQINDDFKKVYQKYKRKSSQNEVQKKKQEEMFWGEIVRSIPENETELATDAEIENVVGIWKNVVSNSNIGNVGHNLLINNGSSQLQMESQNRIEFTSNQISLLFIASRTVDNHSDFKGMTANPYHGYFGNNSNYLANYILLTKLAISYGASVSCNGVTSNDITKMTEDIVDRTTGKDGKSWNELFSWINNKYGTNYQVTDENIRLFIYGLALHSATDIFAHSVYAVNEDGSCEWIDHNEGSWYDADNPDYCPRRFQAAQSIAKTVLTKVYYGNEGYITDFLLSGYFGTFYLKNFNINAQNADPIRYNAVQSNFLNGDVDEY